MAATKTASTPDNDNALLVILFILTLFFYSLPLVCMCCVKTNVGLLSSLTSSFLIHQLTALAQLPNLCH